MLPNVINKSMKTPHYPDTEQPSQYLHEKYADELLPREKLLTNGARALSKKELLAILLGTGKKGLNVLDLADNILSSVNDNLDTLARYDVQQLTALFSGMGVGKAKAVSLVAAMELGSRRIGDKATSASDRLHTASDIFRYIYPTLMNLPHEEVYVIFLNNSNRIISQMLLSQGGMTASVIDTRILMKQALIRSAAKIVLCHNHPSGVLYPSDADIKITNKVKDACITVGIHLLDHIIVGNNQFYSFYNEGHI